MKNFAIKEEDLEILTEQQQIKLQEKIRITPISYIFYDMIDKEGYIEKDFISGKLKVLSFKEISNYL